MAIRTLLFTLLIAPWFLIGQEIEGRWQGSIEVQGVKLKLVFKIEHSGDSLLSVMDSPDQGVKGIPVNSTIFKNDTLRIEMTGFAINYTGVIDSTGSIVGQFNQAGVAFPLTLQRSTDKEKELKRPQEPKKPYPYFEEHLKFTNPVDKITLAGTLTIPKDKAIAARNKSEIGSLFFLNILDLRHPTDFYFHRRCKNQPLLYLPAFYCCSLLVMLSLTELAWLLQ